MTGGPPGKSAYRHARGPVVISWVFLVWRQLLAFGDLLGSDGRVSSTKTAGASLIIVTHIVVLRTNAIAWTAIWAYLLGICVLFGWRGLQAFLEFKKDKLKIGNQLSGDL